MNIEDARRAFAEFQRLWFETPGVSREEATAAALRADDVIESVTDCWDLPEIDGWIEALSHCPEVEKRWHGVAEYREMHRVLGRVSS